MGNALFFLALIFLISIFVGTLYLILSEPKKKTYTHKATDADQERLRLESFERMKRERESHKSVGPTQEAEATYRDRRHLNRRIRREKEEAARQRLTKRENMTTEEDIDADILQHDFFTFNIDPSLNISLLSSNCRNDTTSKKDA